MLKVNFLKSPIKNYCMKIYQNVSDKHISVQKHRRYLPLNSCQKKYTFPETVQVLELDIKD